MDKLYNEPQKQNGWNCFDIAAGITDRRALVAFALQHAAEEEYRHLLATEIRHAAALAYVHMEKARCPESKIAIARLTELFDIQSALESDLAEAEQVELSIDKILAQMEDSDEDLSRCALPSSMHTDELYRLLKEYMDAPDKMLATLQSCNQSIGRRDGNRLSIDELDTFFTDTDTDNQRKYANAFEDFTQKKQEILDSCDQALDEYCQREAIYKQYVNEYYAKNNWFAFQANLQGEHSTSMIDIAARFLNKVIIIEQQGKQIYRTKNQANQAITISYNGKDHFESADLTIPITPTYSSDNTMERTTQKLDSHNVSVNSIVQEQEVDEYILLPKPYKKGKHLLAGLKGSIYQIPVMMDKICDAYLKNDHFELMSEAEEYGKFDDIVFEYKDRIEAFQCKHATQDNQKYNLEDFTESPHLKNNKVQLSKYFDSWCHIKEKYKDKNKTVKIVLYSNYGLETELAKCWDAATTQFRSDFIEGKLAVAQDIRERLFSSIIANSDIMAKSIDEKLLKQSERKLSECRLSIDRLATKDIFDEIKNHFNQSYKNNSWELSRKPEIQSFLLNAVDKSKQRFSNAFIQGTDLNSVLQKLRQYIIAQLVPSKDNKSSKSKTKKIDKSKDSEQKLLQNIKLRFPQKLSFDPSKLMSFELSGTNITFPDKGNERYFIASLFKSNSDTRCFTNDFIDNKNLNKEQQIFRQKLIRMLAAKENKIKDEKRIKEFLYDLELALNQKNISALEDEVVAKIKQINHTAHPTEYEAFYIYLLAWLRNQASQSNTLQQINDEIFKDFTNRITCYFLIGLTNDYRLRKLSGDPLLTVERKVELAALKQFLESQDKSKLVLLLHGDDGTGKTWLVKKLLKDENYPSGKFIFVKSKWLLNNAEYIDSYWQSFAKKELEYIILDEADILIQNEVKYQQLLKEIVFPKKLILIIDSSSVTNALKQPSDVMAKIEQLALPAFSPEQLQEVLKEKSFNQSIILGDRQLTLHEAARHKQSGLFKVMQSPKYLVQLLASPVLNKKDKVKLKREDFIEQAIQYLTPIYSLSQCLNSLSAVACLGVDVGDFPNTFIHKPTVHSSYKQAVIILASLMEKLDKTLDEKEVDLFALLSYRDETIPIEQFKQQLQEGRFILTIDDLVAKDKKNSHWDELSTPIKTKITAYPGKKLFIFTKPDQARDKLFAATCITLFATNETAKVKIKSNSKSFSRPAPIEFSDQAIKKDSYTHFSSSILKGTQGSECTVITSNAGAGKTYNIQQLMSDWHRPQSSRSYQWLICFSLVNLTEELAKKSIKDFVLAYFLAKDCPLTDWQERVLDYDLQKNAIIFLFDGWDEVKEDKKNLCLDFIKQCNQVGSMVLTTRPYAVEKLSITIHKQLNLKPFTEQQIRNYLQKKFTLFTIDFLEQKFACANNDFTEAQRTELNERVAKLNDFIEPTYRYLRTEVNQKLLQVIGIPLQAYLFCESIRPDFNDWLMTTANSSKQSTRIWEASDTFNKAKLYQDFIYAKLKIYFEKQIGVRQASKINSLSSVYRLGFIHLQRLREIAFDYLFQQRAVCQTHELDSNELDHELMELGLIDSIKPQHEPFHPTFFEYFAAAYLLLGLKEAPLDSRYYQQAKETITTCRFEKRYQIVWQFMHEMFAAKEPMLVADWPSLEHTVDDSFMRPYDHIGLWQQYLTVLAGKENRNSLPKPRPVVLAKCFETPAAKSIAQPIIPTPRSSTVAADHAAIEKIVAQLEKLRETGKHDYKNPKKENCFQLRKSIREQLKKLGKLTIRRAEDEVRMVQGLKALVKKDQAFVESIAILHYYVIRVLTKMNSKAGTKLLEEYLTYPNFKRKSKNRYRQGSEYVVAGLLRALNKYPTSKDKWAELGLKPQPLAEQLIAILNSTTLIGKGKNGEAYLDWYFHTKVMNLIHPYLQMLSDAVKKEAESLFINYLNYEGKGYARLWSRVFDCLLSLKVAHDEFLVERLLKLSQDEYSGRDLILRRTRYNRNADRWLASLQPQKGAITVLENFIVKDISSEAFSRIAAIISLTSVEQEFKQHIIDFLQKRLSATQDELREVRNLCVAVLQENNDLDTRLHKLIVQLINYSPKYILLLRNRILNNSFREKARVEIVQYIAKNIRYDSHLEFLKEAIEKFNINIAEIFANLVNTIKKTESRRIANAIVLWLRAKKIRIPYEELFSSKAEPANGLNPAQLLQYYSIRDETALPDYTLPYHSWWHIDAGMYIFANQGNELSPATAAYVIYCLENHIDSRQLAINVIDSLHHLVMEQELTEQAAIFYCLRIGLHYLTACWKGWIQVNQTVEQLNFIDQYPGFIHRLLVLAWEYYASNSDHLGWAGLDLIYGASFIFNFALITVDNQFVIKMPDYICSDILSPELASTSIGYAESYFAELNRSRALDSLPNFEITDAKASGQPYIPDSNKRKHQAVEDNRDGVLPNKKIKQMPNYNHFGFMAAPRAQGNLSIPESKSAPEGNIMPWHGSSNQNRKRKKPEASGRNLEDSTANNSDSEIENPCKKRRSQ